MSPGGLRRASSFTSLQRVPRSVAPDLGGVDVEGGDHLHVAHVVTAQLHVHQPRRRRVGDGVTVVGKPLDERGGAVAYPDHAHPNLAAAHDLPARALGASHPSGATNPPASEGSK